MNREFNAAADVLANLDLPRFEALVRRQVPTAQLCRLAVPPQHASLDYTHKVRGVILVSVSAREAY